MFLLLNYCGPYIIFMYQKKCDKGLLYQGLRRFSMSDNFEAKTVISPALQLSDFQKQEIFRQRIIERRQRKQENDLFMQVAREKHLRNQQRNKFTKIAYHLCAKIISAGIPLRGDNK